MSSQEELEEKAKKYDFHEFLSTWTLGDAQLDAVIKAVKNLVDPLEKEIKKLPDVKKAVRELQEALKEVDSRTKILKDIKESLKTLEAEASEKRGRDKLINWALGALGACGAFLGGVAFFK